MPDPEPADETTGIAKIDVGIRVVQKLGFPIAVAGALLWTFNKLIDDYREGVRSNTSTNQKLAEALTSVAASFEGQADSLESQKKAV